MTSNHDPNAEHFYESFKQVYNDSTEEFFNGLQDVYDNRKSNEEVDMGPVVSMIEKYKDQLLKITTAYDEQEKSEDTTPPKE